ncbi:MAG: PQQ-binding-like beta-propeller repeat protein [Phycisphaerae bacterium]
MDRWRGLALAAMCVAGMTAWTTTATAEAPDWKALNDLRKTRGSLRDRLRQKSLADNASQPPVDVAIELDKSFRRGRLELLLRYQGGRWFVRSVSPLPGDIPMDGIDASGLKWEDDTIRGQIVLPVHQDEQQPSDAAPAEEDEGEEDAPGDAAESADASRQTITVKLTAQKIEKRLILRFARFSKQDWVLMYKPQGDKWVFEKELEGPRIFSNDGGPFQRDYGAIEPDKDGRFSTEIKLTYTGDHERRVEAYRNNQPVVTFSGRIIEGRINTSWVRKAPSGKGIIGSGQDALSGMVVTSLIEGKYRSLGNKGRWMGLAEGTVMPAPADPVAFLESEDPADPPADAAEATVRAAHMYREVRALAMALRNYPMPVTDALPRILVPEPAWNGAPQEAMQAYVRQLAKHAADAATLKEPDVPTDDVSPPDMTFGPFYGKHTLHGASPDNKLPAVKQDGPQSWRPLAGWSMVGPFAVYDQDVPVRQPEVVAVPQAGFRRVQFFTTPEGEVRKVPNAARWMDAKMDGATVYAPSVKEASAGSWRFITWYASTKIESPSPQTVWVSMQMEGQGMVWINDELVWKSGLEFARFTPAVFQVTLRKGSNRVLVRCASNRKSLSHAGRLNWFDGHPQRLLGLMDFHTFAMHVCTQGSPSQKRNDTEAVALDAEAERFRRDGSGIYPDANDVPIAWDIERGINVAWNVELPRGVADPIVRNGRVFVTAEPSWIYCLDAKTGKELWKKQIVSPSGAAAPRGDFAAGVTPVVTDDSVYVTFGSGATARLTHDGEETWLVDTSLRWNQQNMGNPLLADGKLVVQGHLGDRKADPAGQYAVLALDAADGKQLWKATGPVKRVVGESDRPAGLGNGLETMRLRNGKHEKTLILTGDGGVIDAADGTLLHRDVFLVEAIRTPPYVHGSVAYSLPVIGQEAVKFWLDETGRVGVRTLWHTRPHYGRGQVKSTTTFGVKHWMKGPVLHNGRLFTVKVDSAHVPQHYPVPWTQVEAFDADTGERVARMRSLLREATDPTIPPAVADGYLYAGDGGAPVGGFGGATTHGQMVVLKLLDESDKQFGFRTPTHSGQFGIMLPVARSKIPSGRCAPVFEGDRMFLRSFESLACIAVTGEEGRKYQEELSAKIVVNEVVGRRPQVPEVSEFSGGDEEPASPRTPVTMLRPGSSGRGWLMLGPVKKAKADDFAQKLIDRKLQPTPGMEVSVSDRTVTLRQTTPADHLESGELNALKAVEGKRSGAALFYIVLEVGRKQKVLVQPNAVVAKMWIAGREVQSGETLEMDIGYYPMILRVELDRVPPFVKQPKLTLGFTRAKSVFDTPQTWERRVRLLEGPLRRVLTVAEGTSEARTARLALEHVGLLKSKVPSVTKPTPTGTTPTPAAGTENARTGRKKSESEDSSSMTVILAIAAAAVVLLVVVIVVAKKRRGNDDF